MAPLFAIIRYALLETFFCIPILPKTGHHFSVLIFARCLTIYLAHIITHLVGFTLIKSSVLRLLGELCRTVKESCYTSPI